MFFKPAILALVALATLANGLDIIAPTRGASLNPGDRFILELDYRPGQTVTEDVSVVVGLQSCRPPPRANSSPDCSLGALTTPIGSNVLYKGPFAPETTPGGNTTDRQQSFYLQVPGNVQPGRSVIVVSRFALQGSAAGYTPAIDYTTLEVNIA